jgi:hypothetical protein
MILSLEGLGMPRKWVGPHIEPRRRHDVTGKIITRTAGWKKNLSRACITSKFQCIKSKIQYLSTIQQKALR